MTATEQTDRVPTPAWRRPAVIAGGVFLVAFVIRCIHLRQMSAAPFFGTLTGDGVAYDAWARRIAAGDWLGEGVFYQAPLYPYFVGVVHSLAGENPLAVRIVQAVLGSLAAALLAGAARRWFGPPAGWLAGLMLALNPTAIFFESLLQKTVLDTVLLAALLNLLSRVSDVSARRRAALFAGVGAVAGLLTLSRENALILVPPLLAWAIFFQRTEPLKPRLTHAAVLALGLSLTLLPVLVRNKAVGGEFHLTTSQFGSNLYMGNNPTAIGTYTAFRPGRGDARYERTDATEIASAASGRPADRPLSPREVSRYWTGRTLAYIRDQPGHWLRLMGRKCLILVNRVEVVDTDDQYTWSEWSAPLRWTEPLLNAGILLPLAVAGTVLTWRTVAATRWLVLLWCVYAAGVVIFYILARYRFPLVPLMIPLSAAGGVEIVRSIRQRDWKPLAWAGAAAGIAAAVAWWPIVPKAAMRASGLLTAGNSVESSDPALALTYYDRAAALWPNSAELQFSRANALAALNRHPDAARGFLLAIDINPGFPAPRYALARSLLALNHPDGVTLYQRLVDRFPDDPQARLQFAHLLSAQNRFDDAAAQLSRALELRPDWAEAHNARGIAHARAGRLDAAIADFEHALRINPDLTDARDNLERARGMTPTTP